LSYASSLLAVVAAIAASTPAAPQTQTINLIWLPPGTALPKTPDDVLEERVGHFVAAAKFRGIVGLSVSPDRYSTNDTVPVTISEMKGPIGSALREEPFVGEVMRLDQELMAESQAKDAVPGKRLGRVDEAYFGSNRQFDFVGHLPRCAQPVRMRGSVGGRGPRQLVNLMLPERKIALVLWIEDPKFDAGNLDDETGFLPGILSLVACG
jgi:hypothetical protein